jgi:hypothetical protein
MEAFEAAGRVNMLSVADLIPRAPFPIPNGLPRGVPRALPGLPG